MKNIILILFTITSSHLFSQQMLYIPLNLEYNISLPQELQQDSIDIDDNGNVDIIITSWFDYDTVDAPILIELIIKNNDNDLYNNFIKVIKNTAPNEDLRIQDCSLFGSPSQTAYIYNNNPDYMNYTSGYKDVPFQFDSSNGNNCGFLFVQYNNNLITVTGYSWNPISSQSCSCSEAGIKELIENDYTTVFKYYNLLGQEVKEPHGLTIVLYENGVSKKVYFE